MTVPDEVTAAALRAAGHEQAAQDVERRIEEQKAEVGRALLALGEEQAKRNAADFALLDQALAQRERDNEKEDQ